MRIGFPRRCFEEFFSDLAGKTEMSGLTTTTNRTAPQQKFIKLTFHLLIRFSSEF